MGSYEHDKKGYYSKEAYEQGEGKFRPIDLSDGEVVIVDFKHRRDIADMRINSNLERIREELAQHPHGNSNEYKHGNRRKAKYG